MKHLRKYKQLLLSIIILIGFNLSSYSQDFDDTNFLTNIDTTKFLNYIVDTKSQDLQLYWKDDSGKILNTSKNLISYTKAKQKTLEFATNGGMFNKDYSPQGLLILQQKTVKSIDTSSGDGNFYLKPNGIFYIKTSNEAVICNSSNFKDDPNIKFATQSGPMLIIDGQIHAAFKEGSTNLNIRNGVGILPDGRVVFVMSKNKVNFYDFALYFKKLGCKNALYLDGVVSRTYLPEQNWIQLDGKFGVLIGVTK